MATNSCNINFYTIGAFGFGTVLGWSSPALSSLKVSGDLVELSETQQSWIGSLVNVGAFMAGFVIGPLMNRIGRKWTMCILQLPFVIGWCLIIFASNLTMMYSGRILTGFAGGSMTLIVPVYISEIVESRIRGTLSSLINLVLCSGLLFSYVVGATVSWKTLSIINGIIPIIATIIIFMPDSPRFLLQRNKIDEARRALAWLRGTVNLKYIEPEIILIQKSIEASGQVSSIQLNELIAPTVIQPLGIISSIMLLNQLSGINAVMFYSTSIFESAGSDLDPKISTIILGVLQIIFVAITTSLVDRVGRKPLLVVSELGMATALTVLGIYFYLKQSNGDEVPNGLSWLPLVSLIAYIISYNLGIGPLPGVLLGELVPSHTKGLAGGFANSFAWALAFTVTRSFADLKTAITAQGCYWLFAGVCAVGSMFSLFIIPETKGKTLDEINALFT